MRCGCDRRRAERWRWCSSMRPMSTTPWPRFSPSHLSSTFSRLLSLKTKSQYQASSVSASDASRAEGWARRMITAALQIGPT